MKHILILAAMLTTPILAQEWHTAVARPSANQTIIVPAGSLIEFATPTETNSQGGVTLDYGEGAALGISGISMIQAGVKYAGPLTITIVKTGSEGLDFIAASYRITNSTGVSALPSNAVVIPTSSGSVQIILESSTDLITWVAATPGTYGSDTQKRFFRVRAVGP